jgi:hypothetical protein
VLGVAAATTINKVTLTAPATGSTLTIADGKTLTASNTVTLTATDGSTLAIGAGGTLGSAAYTASTAYDVAGAAAAVTPTTLGLVIGTNVQAYDADLTTWAGITPGTGVATALAVAVGSAGAPVVNGGALGTPSSGVGTNITNVNAATLGGATFAAPGAIGGTTPAAGIFTTLSATIANPSHAASRALLAFNSATASLWSYGPDASTVGEISFQSRSSNGSLGGTLAVLNQYGLGLAAAVPLSGTGIKFPVTQNASSDANTLDDYREFTFTATATGMTTAPTGTATVVRAGNNITLEIPAITGTSNATTFTLTGGPTTMRPGATRTVVALTQDNAGAVTTGTAQIGTDGVITLFKDVAGTAFTNSGTKSTAVINVSYVI